MRKFVLVAAALLATGGAMAQEEPVTINGKPYHYDVYNARDIMRTCGGCHGELGAGGGGGVYPRLAGFNPDYLADQLRRFKSHERDNIPMNPYTNDRELPEADILDVSRYLSELVLKTGIPDDLPTDGFARLEAMKKVFQIPREPGDIEAGKEFYAAECGPCHGRNGEGRLRKPPLAGQHIRYLKVQLDNFLAGRRRHDDVDRMRARPVTDWANLWAYVSSLQP